MADNLSILVCENFAREVETVVALEGFNDVAVKTFPARCGHPPIRWDDLDRINATYTDINCAPITDPCKHSRSLLRNALHSLRSAL